MIASPRRGLRRHLWVVVCCAAFTGSAAAQPGPPQITRLVVNGGANLTTADQVSVEFQYTHPAAPGAPIPYYRMRVKPPGGNHLPWGRFFDAGGRSTFTMKLLPGDPSPPGGTYEIQVQLQDGGGRASNVGIGHVIRASPTPTALPAPVAYRIRGAEVATLIGEARLKGYRNTARSLNVGGLCSSRQNAGAWHLRVQKAAVPVPLATELAIATPTCVFGFFEGKLLQYGWRFKSATFERWPTQPANWDDYGPDPSGRDASFEITVMPTGPLGAGEVTLTELVFEGPPGSQWRQAFMP